MHGLVLWAGFLGGWLLFAGPVHQASVELSEVDLEREAIGTAIEASRPRAASGRCGRSRSWWS
jgi:hypothetical protein